MRRSSNNHGTRNYRDKRFLLEDLNRPEGHERYNSPQNCKPCRSITKELSREHNLPSTALKPSNLPIQGEHNPPKIRLEIYTYHFVFLPHNLIIVFVRWLALGIRTLWSISIVFYSFDFFPNPKSWKLPTSYQSAISSLGAPCISTKKTTISAFFCPGLVTGHDGSLSR